VNAANLTGPPSAGIFTVMTGSNWWSYAMAVGFITALLTYGSLLLPTTTPAQDRENTRG
jgi:hypothetical protein